MGNNKHTDTLTFREIEYTIQIKDKDSGYHEVYDVLLSELTRFEDTRKKEANLENPIRTFLKTNIERSIVIRDNTRVYFIDYHEKGSFTIKFTILLITRYTNYGTVRQALDFLIKDTIGDYFEELLERHMPVSITVHSADNEIYEIPASVQETDHDTDYPKRDYLSIILSSFALLIVLIMVILWMFQKNQTTETTKSSTDYRDKYYELLIQKEVEKVFEKEKLNFIIQSKIESISDSGRNNKPKELK